MSISKDHTEALNAIAAAIAEAGRAYQSSVTEALAALGPARAQIATHAPAEQPQPASGGNGTGGGLGERLRALIPATYADDGYFGVTALEIGELAEEADRLERQIEAVTNENEKGDA